MDKEGPFYKDHPMYANILSHCKREFHSYFVSIGRVYENPDRYGGIWATVPDGVSRETAMENATEIREKANAHIGFSIIAKPEYIDADDDIKDTICFAFIPKSTADENEKYGGDAMLGALMRCKNAGIK